MSGDQNLNMLICRTVGHSWDPAVSSRRTNFGPVVTLLCTRCGTHREDVISRFDGELITRSYKYPDHYKSAERRSRGDLRVKMVKKLRRSNG